MSAFFQACGAVMIGVVLILVLGGQGREMGTLVGIGVCCIALLAAISYLRPVLDFLETLETLGGLDGNLVTTLLKAAGIGLISELAGLVCADSGNASLGNAVRILGTVAILWLSLPLFSALLELLQKILGEL